MKKNLKDFTFKEWIWLVLAFVALLGGGFATLVKPFKQASEVWGAPTRLTKVEARADTAEIRANKIEDIVNVSHENIKKICGVLKIVPDTLRKSIFDK